MDDPGKPTISPLVRKFSLKSYEEMPSDTLSQALVSVVHKQDERRVTIAKQQAVYWKWLEFGNPR